MKILTVTTLFPHANNPKLGVFIETRLRQLKQHYPNIEIKVIAPVPWFPSTNPIFGDYATAASAPKEENRFGMAVYHPRYLVVPKIGMTLTPHTLAHSIYQQALKLIEEGYDFDVIDGHYFYPDGVAIEKVAKWLNKPFTVTARGTDINLIPQYKKPKKQIQHVFNQSSHNMAVCEALRAEMIDLGALPSKVTALRNGVDLNLFSYADPAKQASLREQLKLPKYQHIVISVGYLIERKGHHLIIEALEKLPNTLLLIAGSGPWERRLKKQVLKAKLHNRVMFLGSLSQEELAHYYSASDVMVLASSREGWANVLLESMACGTPVVATDIWGTPEVVKIPAAGKLVERIPDSIAHGLSQLLNAPPKRSDTRAYAEQFDWQSTSDGQYQIYQQVLKQDRNTAQAFANDTDNKLMT